jgi:predicted AlkP superfamily phosphohydrolase/phosphomutase
VICLGLDGLDPKLAERFMSEGKMPNLAALRERGSYARLRTTFPSLSPVAWSTFATGVNPAKHNIFDFLDRSLKSYVPRLSSAYVGPPSRVLRLGRYRIPLSRPVLELRRKSQPFWKILGERGIGCTILRVPITFPPEKFDGRLLSAMCTPDIKGTQGSFSQFTTRLEKATFESGTRFPLSRKDGRLAAEIEGPDDPVLEGSTPLRIPFNVTVHERAYQLHIQGQSITLQPGEYTGWIRLTFRTSLGGQITGLARMLLTETQPHVSIYMTPIQIDPDRPALPISHPSYYAMYLANLLGPYATTGMAEDTWALNEGVIDEDAFLTQAYSIFEEREAMFLNALENTTGGAVACVFDTSDRVQHMFFRHLGSSGRHAGVIEDLYRRMDELVGKVLPFVDSATALFVLSDHGFSSFRRGVNVNAWLRENGFLHVKDDAVSSGPYFESVDWSRTSAYALGLGGLYVNTHGREPSGFVRRGTEADQVKREISEKLTALRDTDGTAPVRNVYSTDAIYRGPYLDAAPDLIVGYNEGFRCAWDGAIGGVSPEVIVDNEKAWSGDHCIDPLLVPGVLFSNRKILSADPGIEDLAPTVLRLFGVEPPRWMEGKPLL